MVAWLVSNGSHEGMKGFEQVVWSDEEQVGSEYVEPQVLTQQCLVEHWNGHYHFPQSWKEDQEWVHLQV